VRVDSLLGLVFIVGIALPAHALAPDGQPFGTFRTCRGDLPPGVGIRSCRDVVGVGIGERCRGGVGLGRARRLGYARVTGRSLHLGIAGRWSHVGVTRAGRLRLIGRWLGLVRRLRFIRRWLGLGLVVSLPPVRAAMAEWLARGRLWRIVG
jgi:hypothetical protein